MRKSGICSCVCHFFFVPLQPKWESLFINPLITNNYEEIFYALFGCPDSCYHS